MEFLEIPASNEIENGSIVFYIENPNVEIDGGTGGTQSATRKPKKPRAPVYEFFEWDEGTTRYKCIFCEYVNCRLCCG